VSFALLPAGAGARFQALFGRRRWYLTAALVVSVAIAIAGRPRTASTVTAAPSGRAARPANVLLISIDTLRRDHLGCYGYEDASTPSIDALAGESAVFDDATSPIPLTGPSHVTMLTGLYPTSHGAEDNGIRIPVRATTVADTLAGGGYRTAAFVSGWTMADRAVGLGDRFEHYDDDLARWPFVDEAVLELAAGSMAARAVAKLGGPKLVLNERLGAHTTERAVRWRRRRDDRPFFALVHYFDTHGPHVAPSEAALDGGIAPVFDYRAKASVQHEILADPALLANAIGAYDDEVTYVDREVGKLLRELDALGVRGSTYVILTADHGESLTEHGWYFDHGEFLYETCVRVPLMIRFPDARHRATRWPQQVRLVDVAPTILDIAGMEPAATLEGASLLALVEGTDSSPRTSFGSIRQGKGDGSRARYYVRKDGYKLIWNLDGRERVWRRPAYEELYDLRSDPDEERNVIGEAPAVLSGLREALSDWMPVQPPNVATPSRDLRERLRALGYM
jgi:arylsulfatase A-like enzyme